MDADDDDGDGEDDVDLHAHVLHTVSTIPFPVSRAVVLSVEEIIGWTEGNDVKRNDDIEIYLQGVHCQPKVT